MTILEILNKIAATTKKLEKEAILKEHQEDDVLKECFRLAYSPTVQFFIKKIPDYTKSEEIVGCSWLSIFNVLSALSSRKVTGHAAINTLKLLLEEVSTDTATVIERIISKDLRVGAGANTVNKIWKGLIVKPPRKGAVSMSDKALAKITYPAALELKADGSYAAYNAGFMSRNGNPVEGLNVLSQELSVAAEQGFAVEGELIYDLSKATREEGNGIVGKIIKGTASQEECDSVFYQVWDVISTEDYQAKGVYNKNNVERRAILEELLGDCKHVKIIPRQIVNSFEEANEAFEQYVRDGFEGAILKQLDTPWKDNGKPTDCVKMKRKEPADLEVVDIYEGSGKAKGKLGGVSLESLEGTIKVNCGSGFSDEQREFFWNNPNEIVGKVVEVEYDSITQDKKTKQHSLFLPIFKQVRIDKLEGDSFEEIQSKQRIK